MDSRLREMKAVYDRLYKPEPGYMTDGAESIKWAIAEVERLNDQVQRYEQALGEIEVRADYLAHEEYLEIIRKAREATDGE